MASGNGVDSEHELRLATAVASYHQALEAGQPVDPRAWLASYPDVAPELAEYLAAQEQLDDLAEPLRRAAQAGEDAAVRPPELPRSFGDYELLHEMGRGGMGVIYRARHNHLSRVVALKLIP